MFFERRYQSQLIHEDLDRFSNNRHTKVGKKKRTVLNAVRDKSRAYFLLFLETSSIHGLNHLVAAGRHPLEVVLWLLVVALSVFGSVYLSQTTWDRYQSSPTVVSMDRDMFAWNTTFPCVTICPIVKVDDKKLEQFVKGSKVEDKEQLENFIRFLANSTYQTFDKIPKFDDIPSDQYMELLLNLTPRFKPTLTIGASGIQLNIVTTITEVGVCYAINSRVAVYNSPTYRDADRWDVIDSFNSTFYIHPLDGEVFAQVINLSTGYDVYIHGPDEVPDVATKKQYSDKDYYMKLYVTALTVYTSPDAIQLRVGQRRCRFYYENNLKHNSVYTYNMCRMECRIKLSLKYCGCVPHFYRTLSDEKVCDVSGLHCLARRKATDMPWEPTMIIEAARIENFLALAFNSANELYKLRDGADKKINCDCYPICDDVNYVLQSNVLQEWFLGTNLQWGIVTYPRMRYRRDIIFGFTDVLVAVGGMAGLFLGCSVLSFMEIVYFLTLRLICYTHTHVSKKT